MHYLEVEAPDGRALAYGGAFGAGGSWNSGGDMAAAPVPRTVPPALARARTDLTVRLSRRKGSARTRTFHITCGGGGAVLGKRCRRVLADRWALLPPMLSNGPCPGSPPRRVERQRERQLRGTAREPRLLGVPRRADASAGCASSASDRHEGHTCGQLSVRLRR